MNRKHTARDYLDLVARIRAAQPEFALSTDIIVGFPGETDAEFEETLALFAEVGFAPPIRSSTARGPARRPRSSTIRSPKR